MNTFFEVLYFLLLSLSVSAMWNFSEIFSNVRIFVSRIPYIRRPLICPECSSFWFGFICSFLYNPIVLNIEFYLLTNIFCGLISYLIAHFLFMKRKAVENNLKFIK